MYSRTSRNQQLSMSVGYGALQLRTPYHHRFLGEIKATINEYSRRWDNASKLWWFDASQKATLDALCLKHFGRLPDQGVLPMPPFSNGRFLAEYVGRCNGQAAWSRVLVNGEFTVLIAETAMRSYFNLASQNAREQAAQTQTQTQASIPPKPQRVIPDNPYSLLVVAQTATNAEIESAFRRAARQWHPDVCKEPDAAEWFKAVAEAKRVLCDASLRRQCDTAIRMQKMLKTQIQSVAQAKPPEPKVKTPPQSAKWSTEWLAQNKNNTYSFAPPLRCGWITPRVLEMGAHARVLEIQLWEDDVDSQGRTRVAYWDAQIMTVRTDWV